MFQRWLAILTLSALPLVACQAQQMPMPGAAGGPRAGVDYELIESPQPTFGPPGKIEVAEVFSYHCIHCADFQPFVNKWKTNLAGDVQFAYVHAAFGGAVDNLARGFFAADSLGATAKAHDAVFKAFHVDKKIKQGTIDEVADVYASLGIDRKKIVETMNSFGVTSKINRSKQFAQRTGVNATPTVIVNGKYRVNSTQDRGYQGMLSTIDWLIAKERAAASAAKPAAAPTAKPAPTKAEPAKASGG